MVLYEEIPVSVKVMNLENIKEFFLKLTKQDFSQKQKIFITASLGWIIFVGPTQSRVRKPQMVSLS